jgi:hypothetical protein
MTGAGRLFALPLMLLALWLQAGAAVAAARAQADAANPFGSIPICSPDSPKSDPAHQDPAGQHGANHCGVCLVSAVAHPPPLATTEIVFLEGLRIAAVPALARHVQPRGPPLHRPHARGPPAIA